MENLHKAEQFYHIGLIFQEKAQITEAMNCYLKAIEFNPDFIDVYVCIGSILQEKGRVDEAIAYYEKALRMNPQHAVANYNIRSAFHSLGQLDKAIASYNKAVKTDPKFFIAYNNMGTAYQQKGQLDEAMICYQNALKINPGYLSAYTNKGSVLQQKGQLDEASTFFRNALHIDANYAEAHHANALLFLLSGNFMEGWKEFEWRWKTMDFKGCRHNLPGTLWDGHDISGQTVLLFSEQGFGDIIQFIRYAALIAKLGAKVIVECPKELRSLLESVTEIKQVITKGEALPEFNAFCPILSLPMIFKTTLENIPDNIPYLSATSSLVERWKEKLQKDRSNF